MPPPRQNPAIALYFDLRNIGLAQETYGSGKVILIEFKSFRECFLFKDSIFIVGAIVGAFNVLTCVRSPPMERALAAIAHQIKGGSSELRPDLQWVTNST